MHVWIFQSGEPLQIDKENLRPMRAINLSDCLVKRGHSVTLWTSAFNHQKKYHRTKEFKTVVINSKLKLKLLPSPGYKKNVSLRRFYDHLKLAFELHKFLKIESNELPDVIFIGFPPIETTFILANWSKIQGVPFIIDVKDQWPSIFVEKLPFYLKPLSLVIFSPLYFLSYRSLKKADGISSISQPFLTWSLKFAGRSKNKNDLVVSLSTPKKKLPAVITKKSVEFWKERGFDFQLSQPIFCFAGSFSDIFNFEPIIEVAQKMKSRGIKASFILCGDGPQRSKLQISCSDLDNISFPGWVSSEQLDVLFGSSCASIAPYRNRDDFKKSIPNKIIDSLAHDLPFLTSLEGEVKNLASKFEAGLFYQNSESLFRHCMLFLQDTEIHKKFCLNARNCYEKEFDFELVYGRLACLLESISKK